jgi:gliding motility-associated-like protein
MNITKYLFLFIMLICQNSFAQKQNNQWRFGGGAAIDFNTVPPSFVNGCVIVASEGSASVADKVTGALLFYTDGVTVWNANNQVMPNGTGLLGGDPILLSSTTAAVIVPKPGSSNLYYIVTVHELLSPIGVNYSVVDMNLNGGLGDIVAGQKNIFIIQTGAEKLEVVPASDGTSFWLLTDDFPGNSFYAFKISNTGIQNTPVVSTVGSGAGLPAGHMKINRQYNKIAIGAGAQIEVFDFDNATGILSNPIAWNVNLPGGLIYGIEFSPDGKVLYLSDFFSIFQYDLTQTTPLAIQNSLYQIATVAGTLQLGIDNKIYVSTGCLSAINCPNNLGAACGYQTCVIANQTAGGGGLPKWVYYADDDPISTFNTIIFNNNCFPGPVLFSIADTTGISNVTWNFGDPNSGVNNTAVGFTANHTFSQIGNYNVQAILTTTCGIDTLFTDVAILNPCNPQVEQCDVFQYTGTVQQWTVPSGIDSIRVKMWGAAGGGGPFSNEVGGGGGYTQFALAVTPGESFEISVGQGGKAALGGTGGAGGWPGGGDGGSGTLFESPLGVPVAVGGGGGGGGATIFKRITNNTIIAVAGAGGGSAFGRNGGSGGGLEGQFTALTNTFNQFGFGGTQTAGGAPGQNTISTNSVLGSAGLAFQGGDGATDLNPNTKGGGGGGSGYYGGGGGSAYDGNGFGVGSVGGGGSGFLLCTNCPNLSGSLVGADQFDGTPANPNDPLLSNYPGTGTGNMNSNGGNGIIQICYSSAACLPTTATIAANTCSNYTSPSGTTYNQTGNYLDTIINSNGCDSIIQINLTITGLPTVAASSVSASCGLPNGTATATATGGSGNYSYSWSNGATGNFVTGLASGNYSVTATDQNGCASSPTQVTVLSGTPSGGSIDANDTCLENRIPFSITTSATVSSVNWNFDDPSSGANNTSTSLTPTHLFSASGTYNIRAIVNLSCGVDTIFKTLSIKKCDSVVAECQLFVPSAFTPNNDGKNDKFNPQTICPTEQFECLIYSRWGELIFKTSKQTDKWDGKYKGADCATGVYVYFVKYKFSRQPIKKDYGSITLLR